MNRDFSFPLRVSAEKFGARTALVYGDRHWRYDELDAATDRLAAGFESTGLTGRRVVVLMRDEPMALITYLALARSGAVAVPVNPKLLAGEIEFICNDSSAGTIIADAEFVETARGLFTTCETVTGLITVHAGDDPGHHGGEQRLEDLLSGEGVPATVVAADSLASIVYTSGTSGFPKGVMRTHDANLWAVVNSVIGQNRTRDDVEVFVLRLFGIAFLFQVMPMILAGGTVVLDGQFNPGRTWELLEKYRATRIFLAPTMIDSLLSVPDHEDRDVSALRVLNTAYEFPERVRVAAEERFGPIIAYMYGLTEAQLCVSTPEEFAADHTNAGHAMGLMRIRVVDAKRGFAAAGEVGEIALSGPSVMSGYLDREEATAEALVDGWLLTGDLGYVDDFGRIHVTGRKKEIIKTGGFTVDPVEVENVLLTHERVQEAAVVGVPDEHWGERAIAFLVADPEPTPEELIAHAKEQLATYKVPKQVFFLDELPRTPTGKVQRGKLRTRTD